MNDTERRTMQTLSNLPSRAVEAAMRLEHPAWRVAGNQVLAARACIGLGLLPLVPEPSANRFERAVRVEVPATGNPLATQGKDLRKLLVFVAREIIEGCAAAPVAPEGLLDFHWHHFPSDHLPDGIHMHEPKLSRVALVSGDLPTEMPRTIFVRPQMAGRAQMTDFCGIPHTLDWRVGWDTAARVGVLWFGPRSPHPNHREAP